jgi:hypothetical protein
MITRRHGFPRLYSLGPVYRDNRCGLVRVFDVDGIPVARPVARPGGVYHPGMAPDYLVVSQSSGTPNNQIVRSVSPVLRLSSQHIAMDPSDRSTWQRPYRFA